MQKIQVSFDASKLDKTLMRDKNVDLEIIPLKNSIPVTRKDGTEVEGGTWKLMKTHFVVQSNKNKEVKMPIIGSGTVFQEKSAPTSPPNAPTAIEYPVNDIDANDIPFS